MMQRHSAGYAPLPAMRPGAGRDAPPRQPSSCWSRLSHAPWRSLAFGDDLESFAFLLVLVLLLLPFLGRLFPLIVLALVGLFMVRIWLWCRAAAAASATPPRETT